MIHFQAIWKKPGLFCHTYLALQDMMRRLKEDAD